MINEERPAPDRIEGSPLPAESTELTGHADAANAFLTAYRSGRMHHAWLLTGPRGIGKATLALHLARHVLNHPLAEEMPASLEPEGIHHAIVRQVAQAAHPDLLHLQRPWDDKTKRFKTALSVDEVRRTQSFYGLTAGAGGWRITIVDAADDMNANAANALLKILEEPPKRSIFFILSHAPGRLLATTRSRCRTLALSPLTNEQVADTVGQLVPDAKPKDIERAAAIAQGSVRQAIELLDGPVLKEYGRFERLMQNRASGSPKDWLDAHAIADALSRRGQENAFQQFLELAIAWVAGRARLEPQVSLAQLAGWGEVWNKLVEQTRLAEAYNLDKKQVILSLFSNLFERNAARM